MIKFTQEMMHDLSFEDEDVEKMEFSRIDKMLKIFVQGAWMSPDENGVYTLGKGVLFFSDWESLSIKQFDSMNIHEYSLLEGLPEGGLKDLLEVSFSDEIVSLGGFGSQVDYWLEWIIVKPKMHAEFEEYQE